MSSIYLRFFGKNRKGTIEKGKVKESNDQESLTQEATPLLSNRSAYGNPSKRKNGKSVAIKESRQSISLSPDVTFADPPADSTLARRLARYMSQFSWYCPTHRREALDKAWAYFEHFTLARYYKVPPKDSNDLFVKAPPGERCIPTLLYPLLSTPDKDLADFGVGVGLYFYTLKRLALIMFLAGLCSIPNLLYFGSDEYNAEHEFERHEALIMSAVCTDRSWKACPTCTWDQWDYFPQTFDRYAEAIGQDGRKRTFILINNCNITRSAGIVAYITMLLVCIAIMILVRLIQRKERSLDKDQQTGSDYSVAVANPPSDAKNPDQWHAFFSQFGHVTAITIAYNNEELLHKLMERRELLLQLEGLLPAGVVVDPQNYLEACNLALPVSFFSKVIGTFDARTIHAKILKIDEIIQRDYSQREYDVSEVFVVFETEEARRHALQALELPKLKILMQDTSSLDKDLLFRGSVLLDCSQAPEPETVRWQDLDETILCRIKQQSQTLLLTIIAIVFGCAFVIYVRLKYGAIYAAFAITGVNSAAPYICHYLVDYYESHPNVGGFQRSLYLKITAFLWITTSLLTSLITPFTNTLENKSDSLIPAMYAIFITETLKAPATEILDPVGHFKRHVLAPRAKDRKRMYSCFQGKAYLLSQKYTDLTNILFLTFYYGLLFPAGFFLAAISLYVHYWTDRFCLLRVWSQSPPIGDDISYITRTYFFSAALIVYTIVSAYSFASFPYDNACGGPPVPKTYVGSYNATTGEGVPISIDIDEEDSSYFFCNQDMIQYKPPVFPAIPTNQPKDAEWMSSDQKFANVFACTSLLLIAVVLLSAGAKSWQSIQNWFVKKSRKDSLNKDSPIPFSATPVKNAYIPQVHLPGDPFPVLFCDISDIDPELLSWKDPDHPDYKSHNAIYDVLGLSEKPLFSTVHHWPPE